MVYVVGIIGFISGFVLGQFLLAMILRNRPSEDLVKNKKLHWIYGTMNWIIAFFVSYLAIHYYQSL